MWRVRVTTVSMRTQQYTPFSDVLAKLRKSTISFLVPVRPSICPHGTTRLPLDGFSWKAILKPDKNNEYSRQRRMYIYDNISLNSR